MLSRVAQEFADEIANHDWSDAPYRLDRAGHSREHDSHSTTKVLSDRETDAVRTNVMWVAAQVLLHADPNLDPHRSSLRRAACPSGSPTTTTERRAARSRRAFAGRTGKRHLPDAGPKRRAVAGGRWHPNVLRPPARPTTQTVTARPLPHTRPSGHNGRSVLAEDTPPLGAQVTAPMCAPWPPHASCRTCLRSLD